MNKNIINYLLLSLLLLSCHQIDGVKNIDKVETITATVKIEATAEVGVPTPTNYKIKLTNFEERFEIIINANKDGEVDIDKIIPGIYSVNVSAEVLHNGFTYNFNGNISQITIIESGLNIPIDITSSKSGNIIFKEIYYSGSRTAKGGPYFRDQYYELYNNSNNVQYLDGLCIGDMYPGKATVELPTWDVENPDDHVFFSTIWQVPGTGKDYPLQPGEAIIIAQMGDNHQKPNLNPNSPVNLISVEFETFVKSTSLVSDNPALNMQIAFWPKRPPQWLVTVFGGAYAIFYPSESIDDSKFVSPKGSTAKCYMIPNGDIMDAVECITNEASIQLKRVPAILDAGAATVGATYCSKSISRKIKETLPDGRIIFFDTNNSTEDFEVMELPKIRRYDIKTPSWNTWK